MKYIKTIIKVITAGILAILILSFIFYFYTFSPIHVDNKKGNTDYVWEPNSRWIKMSEGISYGKFDSQGFNNKETILNPDIILLGSSHMEAVDVLYDKSITGILNAKIKDATVYNYGISGHDFYKVLHYLPKSLESSSKAPKIAIIETSFVELTKENVADMFNDELVQARSSRNKLITVIQRFPFLKQVYHQYQHGIMNIFLPKKYSDNTEDENIGTLDDDIKDKGNNKKDNKKKKKKKKESLDFNPYEEIFKYLSDIEKEYGTQIIIFFHPLEYLDGDGDIVFVCTGIKDFTYYANKYDIDFVDMTDTFEKMYYNQHKTPHGFITENVGYGHLNADGHAAIANELYKVISEKAEE